MNKYGGGPGRIAYALVAVAAAAGVLLLLGVIYMVPDPGEDVRQALSLDATYYPGDDRVVISYADGAGATGSVDVEVLGMSESYRVTFSGPEFTIDLPFASAPKYGWAAHPVVVETVHPKFGNVQMKTEVHEEGQQAPRVIYAVG